MRKEQWHDWEAGPRANFSHWIHVLIQAMTVISLSFHIITYLHQFCSPGSSAFDFGLGPYVILSITTLSRSASILHVNLSSNMSLLLSSAVQTLRLSLIYHGWTLCPPSWGQLCINLLIHTSFWLCPALSRPASHPHNAISVSFRCCFAWFVW